MPEQNADLLKVLVCQVTKYRDVDSILGKAVGIFDGVEIESASLHQATSWLKNG
jgi:hypothetical protein